MSVAGIVCVGRRSWLVIFVGRDGITTWCDEGRYFAGGSSCGSPVLGEWAVVVLVPLISKLWHILRSMRRVHARIVSTGSRSVVVWEDVLSGGAVQSRWH